MMSRFSARTGGDWAMLAGAARLRVVQWRDPHGGLRHDGQRGHGVGGEIPRNTPGDERPSPSRRVGRGHRQPDRRQLRHGQRQPQNGGPEIERVRPSGGWSPRNSSSVSTPWPSTSTRTIRWSPSPWRNWPRSTARAARSPSGRSLAWSKAWATTKSPASAGRTARAPTPTSARRYGQGTGL